MGSGVATEIHEENNRNVPLPMDLFMESVVRLTGGGFGLKLIFPLQWRQKLILPVVVASV
jgi:hypothetical protein